MGKTTLVTALAKASGHGVVRINLSEHTVSYLSTALWSFLKPVCCRTFIHVQDTSDLFGSDLPVEGTIGLKFAWKDGPFLKALKNGDWILLDEVHVAINTMEDIYIHTLDKYWTRKWK